MLAGASLIKFTVFCLTAMLSWAFLFSSACSSLSCSIWSPNRSIQLRPAKEGTWIKLYLFHLFVQLLDRVIDLVQILVQLFQHLFQAVDFLLFFLFRNPTNKKRLKAVGQPGTRVTSSVELEGRATASWLVSLLCCSFSLCVNLEPLTNKLLL